MKKYIIFMMSLSLISCGGKNEEDPANPSLASTNYVVESGLNALSSMIDEQTGDPILAMSTYQKTNFLDLIIAKAYAGTACGRAISQACSDSRRTLTYNNCTYGNKTYQGVVDLSYSQSNCSFFLDGDNVTRTFSSYVYGAHNGYLVNSSNTYYDYRRISYGGGTKLTRLANGDFQLDILGRHAQVTINNYLAADISIRSTSPITVSRGLSRNNRQLDGGPIEVSHNMIQYTGSMTVSNLRYQDGCCYPISGTVTVTYTGRRTGTSVVDFNKNSCGKGTITEDGSTSDFQMNYCE